MQLCIQLGKYKVYNGAQGYGVEGWAHRKGRRWIEKGWEILGAKGVDKVR